MRIVLLGSPGSGKGTQASRIAEKFCIPHISTGDLFRKNIKEETPIGIEAKKYIDKGLLVPDDLVVQVLELRLYESDCINGYLLDGFPRTLVQAEILNSELEKIDKRLLAVLNLSVSDETIISRMTGRRICSKCNANYNLSFKKPKVDDICDSCGGQLITRDDDKLETVSNRLRVYKEETQPLIEYYKKKGLLTIINGEQHTDQVFMNICKALESI